MTSDTEPASGSDRAAALRCSVVVPTRGSIGPSAATVRNLLDQDIAPADYEIIVVDNNDDPAVSEALAASLSGLRVRLVHQPAPGPAAARNRGIDAASADVVVFVDDDLVVDRRFLASHLAGHAAGSDVVVGRIEEHNSHSRWFRRYLVDRRVVNRAIDPERVDFRNFYGANSSVRRELLTVCGGFDESLIRREDTELGYRLWCDGARFAVALDAVGRHHSTFGPRDLVRRAYWSGVFLAAVIEKHPALADYEDLSLFAPWKRWLAAVASPVLAVIGVIVYPLTPRLLHQAITGFALVKLSRGYRDFRAAADRSTLLARSLHRKL